MTLPRLTRLFLGVIPLGLALAAWSSAAAAPTNPSATPTLTLTPTPAPTLPLPTAVPGPARPLRAWSVAPEDGAVYVLDADRRVVELSPGDLSPRRRSVPFFAAAWQGDDFLLAGDARLFVGQSGVTRTLVLRADDFRRAAVLERAGPMALDPGHHLFMISDLAVWAYDLADLSRPPRQVVEPLNPKLGYGSIPRDLATDPTGRRLIVRFYEQWGSPPHNPDVYRTYDLDSLAELSSFNRQLGTLTRPAVAEEAGLIVGVDFAKNGLLGSDLAVFDREGEELQIHHSLQGLPAVDPAGRWIYLLRAGDVWVLRRADLALVSVYVPDGPMPQDLAVSPDGRFVYFFSPQELAAVPARTLQTWGIPPAPSFPSVATQEEDWPRLLYYPSPSYDQDEAAFVLTSDCGELYRSQDGGRSWQYLPDLFYPDTAYIHFLSVSPDFALDRTLVASGGDIGTMWRSVDAGDTWQAWTPPLAFVSERDGSRDIYTMDADGQQVQRRTANPAADENPAWSPAWTRIAFQSDRTGNWDIFSIKAGCTPEPPAEGDECDLQQLTDDPADDMLPAWSPDGRFIAFVSTRDGNPELYLMPSQGGAARRLTFDPAGDWRPAWLPDSQRLLFTSGRSGDNDIFMLRALPAGAEPELTLVAGGPSDERDPAVNRSSQPLFLSDRDGVFRPYYVRNFDYPSFSSINPLLKAIPEVPDGHPAWVDDGLHTILVASERAGDSNVYRVEADRSSPQGVRYSPLAASPAFDGQPAWGPAWWQSAQALPE